MAEITIENLRKEYGSTVAVEELSLSLSQGELLVLVGPSGSGKSTALWMVAGLVEPTSGSIQFDGEEITGTQPENRDISMVFQDLALYPHMTVSENIAFPLEANGALTDERKQELIEESASRVDADHLLGNKVTELSGGQAQRVALARALVRHPEVFLLDEPLSDLDELLSRKLRSEIATLQDDLDVTTIHVTHDQEEAMTIGDRIAVMSEGRLVQVDKPRTVYNEPATPFVAGFIGSPEMNAFQTSVESIDDESVVLVDEEVRFTFGKEVRDLVARADGEEITVGIRPQHVGWSDSEPSDDISHVRVTVDLVEIVGTEDIVHCETAEGREIRAMFESARVEEGQDGYLTLDSADLHLFDGHDANAPRLN